jgi:CO dehydrogenase/acetyl-CoA synthase gamma subunit (corrinoid Fe-S protein)
MSYDYFESDALNEIATKMGSEELGKDFYKLCTEDFMSVLDNMEDLTELQRKKIMEEYDVDYVGHKFELDWMELVEYFIEARYDHIIDDRIEDETKEEGE